MKKLLQTLIFTLLGHALASSAFAQSCWKAVGWSSSAYVGAEAIVEHTECTTTPSGWAWARLDNDRWVLISLSDSRVDNGVFRPILRYSHDDAEGKPVFVTDVTCCGSEMVLLHDPPSQGPAVPGSRVRLRHRQTMNCIETSAANGDTAQNRPCSGDPGLTFVLDDAGGGFVRLRNEQDSQCLYTHPWNNGTVDHWVCWNDPAFRFELKPFDGGYILKNVSDNQCLYGNPSWGGNIHTWGCWNDPNMVYFVDLIELPFEPLGMWPFEAPGGSTLYDLVGDNDGTIARGAIRIDGKIGGGLDFDGVDDYARIPDHADIDLGSDDFSILFWIRTTQGSGVRVLLDKRTPSPWRGWHLYLYNGKLGMQLANGAGYTNYNSLAHVSDGNWHHVAVTVDRDSNQGISWYLDGQKVGNSQNPMGRQGSLANASELRLAVRSTWFSGFWRGSLDQLEIYRGALDEDAIESLADPNRF